jgi:two-component system NarL family sensor kinase
VTPGAPRARLMAMTTTPAPSAGRRVLAAALVGPTIGLVVVAGTLAAWLGWTWTVALESFVITNAVMALSFGICGGILAWHRPGNPIGWLFASGGLLQAVAASVPPIGDAARQVGASEVTLRLLSTAFVYSWPWAIGLCYPLALLLFPDGRPVSPRWRPVVVAVVVTAPLFVLELGSEPEPVEDGGPLAYVTIAAYDRLAPLWQIAELRTIAAYLAALVALAVRYRRGSEGVRRQLLWLLVATVLVVAANLLWGLVAGTPIAILLTIPLIPVTVTVAIVRYGLLDIRLVASRALTWLLLSLGVLAAYVAVVTVLDRFVSAQLGRSALTTVLLVLLAAPLLPRLQRVVDRAMYGDRADPVLLVSRLGVELSTTASGFAGVAAAVRTALKLPYVGIEREGQPIASDGALPVETVTEDLGYDGDVVGTLTVGLRPGERRLADADRRILATVAAPLAVALHAVVVSAELQRSREQIVEAREEERRRLRRELHDGLGPTLTGIAFAADAAANHVRDPERVEQLLAALRRDARAALADVRRVVEDLRPPALDELGLVGALRQRADQLGWRADGTAVRIQVDAPELVPALPAAVEVAAYRIATEALTNVARHSRAEAAVLRLRCEGPLEVSVTDDGPPLGPWLPGVGLRAMHDRALELGGSFSAGPTSRGGVVQASLPVGAP